MDHLVVFPHPPPLYFLLFISVMGTCLLGSVGAHGWVVRLCQPSVQSPSWGWLPIVEAPVCLRQPCNHYLVTQSLTTL